MPLPNFDELYQQADALPRPVGVAVAGGADQTVLEAIGRAVARGWVDPIVVGREAEIRATAHRCGVDLAPLEIIDSDDVAGATVSQVREGRAQLLMKGQISTPVLMRAVLDQATGLRAQRVVSQVVLMEIAAGHRSFLLADTGICIQPTLEQKVDILQSAVGVAQSLESPSPRVALMAATEAVSEKMPETVDAQRIVELVQTGEFPDCAISGPLSFDLAYSAQAAQKKHAQDPVAGNADVMIFPNLASANLTVKAIMYTADCRFGGLLVGTSHPVVFMSRADTTSTRLNSLALALKSIS